jgi:hypothetical protein
VPTIRAGRGVLHVHDMGTPPPANPSGPVQRVGMPSTPSTGQAAAIPAASVAPAKPPYGGGSSLAASRARGAAAGGFVRGHTGPKRKAEEKPKAADPAAAFARFSLGRAAHVASLKSKLTDRQQQVIDELRRLGSRRAVQEALGVTHLQSIDGSLIDAFEKGLLPADLPDLPPGRTAAVRRNVARQRGPALLRLPEHRASRGRFR